LLVRPSKHSDKEHVAEDVTESIDDGIQVWERMVTVYPTSGTRVDMGRVMVDQQTPGLPERLDGVPPRVLVADDQPDVVMALRLLLRDAGFDADTASSVHEVRTRLDRRPYDLLLMDLNYARDTTSGQEGLELLEEVRARDPLLPVVVMTGWGSIDTAVEAMRRGARSFVPKPWDNAALAAAVAREVQDGIVQRQAHSLATREHQAAQSSQRSLLPSSLPEINGCRLAARWQPAFDLGGDCYDAIELSPSRLAISIADVCGKGLSAALLMSHLQASVRAFAAADPTPASVATNVNRALCKNIGLARFVTVFYATYDAETRRMAFTNAGHNPPLLVHADGSCERLSTGGMILGVFEHATFEEGVVQLDPGDRVILFTDGITEAMSDTDGEFGDDRLAAAIGRRKHAPVADLVNGIFADVTAFANGQVTDDATVVAMAVD
jgi:sigma-B regulation protein RsbU (phosphoserine phosphatase)